MKWLLVTLGVLLVAVGAAYVMGSRLPVEHLATVRAQFHVPPDSVYAAVNDVAAYPSWRTDVKRVEMLPPHDGHVAWRESSRTGALEYEFTLAVPPFQLVSTLTTPDAGFTGRWMFHFLPDTAGTTVLVSEEGSVRNPFFRFLMHYVFGEHASLERFLGMLGHRFGETVQPTRVD
jgi:uncharacterized protein YndB with AHSA1/START domain